MIDSVNHLDSVENFQKDFYDKPKFNIPADSDLDCYCVGERDCISVVPLDRKGLNVHLPESDILPKDLAEFVINTEEPENSAGIEREILVTNMAAIAVTGNTIATSPGVDPHEINCSKMSDAFLSDAKEDLLGCGTAEEGSVRIKRQDVMNGLDCVGLCAVGYNSRNMEDSNRVVEEWEKETTTIEKLSKEEQTASEKEKDDDSVVPRKKEKMEINYSIKKNRSNSCTSKMDLQQQEHLAAGAIVRRQGSRAGQETFGACRNPRQEAVIYRDLGYVQHMSIPLRCVLPCFLYINMFIVTLCVHKHIYSLNVLIVLLCVYRMSFRT